MKDLDDLSLRIGRMEASIEEIKAELKHIWSILDTLNPSRHSGKYLKVILSFLISWLTVLTTAVILK